MRLLLIRHGQTPSNVLGKLDTDAPGPGLTELGEEQAESVTDALDGRFPQAIFSSPLVRTQLTAAPLAEHLHLPITVLPGLREVEAGDLEDRSDPASVHLYLETCFAWAQGDQDRRMPGATDGHEFFARYDEAVAAIVHSAEGMRVAAAFSHGMAIRVWAANRSGNISDTFASTHELLNTGMVTLESADPAGPDGRDGRDRPAAWSLVDWHSEPLSGEQLDDVAAIDPLSRTLSTLRDGPGSAL